MADPFNLDLTATQINTALNNAHDSDKAPASGDANLVNSNKIHQFVTSQVGAEADVRVAADAALDASIHGLRLGLSSYPYSHLEFRSYANNIVFGTHVVNFSYQAGKSNRTESFQFALKDFSGVIRSSVHSGSVSVAGEGSGGSVARYFSVTLNLTLNSGLADFQLYRLEVVLGNPAITSVVQTTLNTLP